ncbi:MAG: M48 family metallopeptidase [Deltaproteobacteria bacterium]|nr:M48 family metallopeptidase [Deltaproteobacteria bacterium]
MVLRSFQFGNTRISYRTIRSSRRTTIGIAVKPDGKVVASVPQGITVSKVDRAIRSKARWIYQKQLEARELQSQQPSGREFVDGETFKYLGRGYRLRISVGHQSEVRLMNGRLRVIVANKPASGRKPELVRSALIEWYRQHAIQRLAERMDYWSRRMGISRPRMLLGDQNRRWGSCSAKGEVRINWRIIQAPMRIVDYVIVHELVHLIHPDHSRAYWKALHRVLPDAPQRKSRLYLIGPELMW